MKSWSNLRISLLVGMMFLSSSGGAQALRRNDLIGFVDRVRCTQPHSWSSNNVGSFLGKYEIGVHAAGTVQAIDRGSSDNRNVDGVGTLRGFFTSTAPCADAWYLHVDGIVADAGASGTMIEGALPAHSFGHRGDMQQEAIGSVTLYGGASTTRQRAYDPALDLSRDAWMGATLQLGLPARIPIPVLGPSHIMLHAFASVQGDYAWDHESRERRENAVVPHFNILLPLTVLRTLPPKLPIIGLGYSYDRVDGFLDKQALVRHMLGLSTFWLDGQLTVTVHGGIESLGGQRAYRAVGLSIAPTSCAKCVHTF